MYHYDNDTWHFTWKNKSWRFEDVYPDRPCLVYTAQEEAEIIQIFTLYRSKGRYGEFWTPVDVTGFWISESDHRGWEMYAGAPIGAFLRELATVPSQTSLKKTLGKTYNERGICGCSITTPVGCQLHPYADKPIESWVASGWEPPAGSLWAEIQREVDKEIIAGLFEEALKCRCQSIVLLNQGCQCGGN